MADSRSRREKLEAMANQTVSPNEAEIARILLREIDAAEHPGGPSFQRPAFRDEVYARVDDFLFSVERNPSSVRVTYAGDSRDDSGQFKKGLLGAMLREALREERPLPKGDRQLLD